MQSSKLNLMPHMLGAFCWYQAMKTCIKIFSLAIGN